MLTSVFSAASDRVERIRRDVTEVLNKRIGESDIRIGGVLRGGSGGSGSSSEATGVSMFGNQASNGIDQGNARRQYQAFKNTVATAIRPIIVRFSGQPVRVGYTVSRGDLANEKGLETLATKAFSLEGEKIIRENAPKFIKASIGSSVTTIESHPFLDLVGSPNEYMTGYGLMQCTAASLSLTGRSAWWFDSSGDVRQDTGNATRLWYVPWHWLTPSGPRSNPFATFKLRMPASGEIEIAGEDIFYSMIPHPEDPSRSWSAIQSQASSIDTDENILMAQHTSMKNVIRPNLIITAGRMPGMPNGSGVNRGPRALLDKTARESLINAIKSHYQGVMKFGEPLILDALIEDVKPLMAGPMELDLVNSSSVTQSRIMQGVGTSPVVAGYSENANRAGSVVAHEIFYELVLNPLINLFSQSLDVMVKRRYGLFRGGKTTLKAWMDEAKPRDVDQTHERFLACRDMMTKGEIREYLRSGNLIISEKSEDDDAWARDFLVGGAVADQAASQLASSQATTAAADAVKQADAKAIAVEKAYQEQSRESLYSDFTEAIGTISARPIEVSVNMPEQKQADVIVNMPEVSSTFNIAMPEPPVQNITLRVPRAKAPIVNVPEVQPPNITVNVPPSDITVKAPNVTINVPEQSTIVNVNVPEQVPPNIVVNVPEQSPPIINVTQDSPVVNVTVNPEIKLQRPDVTGVSVVRDASGRMVGLKQE